MTVSNDLFAQLEVAQTGRELLAVIDAYLNYEFRAKVQ